MSGKAAESLEILSKLHAVGADPGAILEDLLELTHFVTRLKLAPGGSGSSAADLELKRGTAFAERLGMPVLTRTWQLLLKGLGELQGAPDPHAAAEMVVLRLVYAADLPSPGELVRQLRDGGATTGPGSRSASPPVSSEAPPTRGGFGGGTNLARSEPMPVDVEAPQAALPAVEPALPEPLHDPKSFREVVRLFATKREGLLEYHLASSTRLVRFEPGIIEFNTLSSAPPNLANRVGTLLSSWTGRRWVVGISSAPGEPTIAEVDEAHRTASFDAARASPTVQALMEAFPGAVITDVRDLTQPPAPAEEASDTAYPSEATEMTPEIGDEP